MSTPDPATRKRFYRALGAYAVLGLAAARTLEGNLRWFILILLAGLAVKSWVDVRRRELD
jgi:diacylglycerol kinase